MITLWFALLMGYEVAVFQIKGFPDDEECALALREVKKIYKHNLITVECHEETKQ